VRKILYIGLFVFIFSGKSVFAEELKQKIEITLEDQVCTTDEDCVSVFTECVREDCECAGQSVNKIYSEKYVKLLQECMTKNMEAGTSITACDMECRLVENKCISNHCQVIEQAGH